MDIAPGGQIHHRIGAPADGPDQLVHLGCHVRGDGGIADVGVDLHQEVPPDQHGLGFRVVGVGRQDTASGGDFGTDELRLHSLADGGVGHFRGDDAGTGIGQLGRAMAGLGPQGLAVAPVELRHVENLAGLKTVILGADFAALHFHHIATG